MTKLLYVVCIITIRVEVNRIVKITDNLVTNVQYSNWRYVSILLIFSPIVAYVENIRIHWLNYRQSIYKECSKISVFITYISFGGFHLMFLCNPILPMCSFCKLQNPRFLYHIYIIVIMVNNVI